MSSHQGRPVHRDNAKVGGAAHVKGTTVPVWTLVQCKQKGMTDAQVLQQFPQLTQDDLFLAWHFTQHSAHEIEADIAKHVESDETPARPTPAPAAPAPPNPTR